MYLNSCLAHKRRHDLALFRFNYRVETNALLAHFIAQELQMLTFLIALA